MSELLQVAAFAVTLAMMLLFGRAVFDLIRMFSRGWKPTGIVLVLANIVYGVTDPPIRAIGRVIKPVRFGGVSLDLGFLVVLIVLMFLQRAIFAVASIV